MSGEQWSRTLTRRGVLGSVIVVGAAIVVWAVPGAIHFAVTEAPAGFWAMSVSALVVDVPLFGITRFGDLRPRSTLSVCFTFAILVLWGAAPAVLVQTVAGAVTGIGQRYRPIWVLYMVGRLVCATAASQLVVTLVYGPHLKAVGVGLSGRDMLGFLLLTVVWLAVSYGLLAVGRATLVPGGIRQAAGDIRVDMLGTAATLFVVSPLLTTIELWWKALVVLPLLVWNLLVRQQRQHEERLSREPVSGALNRQGLAVGLKSITDFDTATGGRERPFGIVLVDVESVLTINRLLGRDIYEDVVVVAARRLVDAYGSDRVARLTGEAMVVLVPGLTEADAAAQAEEVVEVLAPPFEVDDVPFSLDPAGGVALSPQHGRELGTLLAKAELAMIDSRRHGRKATLYVRQATEITQHRLELVRELRNVLRDPERWGEVGMLYQPQVDLDTGRLTGVESLVRWTHREWGPVPTDELIEAVEPTEVMHLLTQHILRTVVSQVRRWNDEGRPLRVAVNVSVQDLHNPTFVEELDALLDRLGVPADQITIEITERMLLTDEPRVRQVAGELAQLGLGLSLDDFGTGHASLQQLRLLPLSEVKVDRAYVSGIVENTADRAVVTSVHELAQALGVVVVAEGVEDRRTAETLATLPGVIGQGWHFGAPMRPDELHQHIDHDATWTRQL